MATLHIIYDPSSKLLPARDFLREELNIKAAVMDVSDDLKGKDIYTLARKLAEMLLEQL